MITPTLVLIGPHGAGKTTVGRLVAARLGVRFDVEIGASLRRRELERDPTMHAMASQEAFDDEVMALELARADARDGDDPLRVVETWHPGNIAYASSRSPAVARRYRAALSARRSSWREAVVVQPLTVSRATALSRLSEPGPDPETLVAYFREVAARAEREARALGLRVLPPLATDALAPDELASRVAAAWSRLRAPSIALAP